MAVTSRVSAGRAGACLPLIDDKLITENHAIYCFDASPNPKFKQHLRKVMMMHAAMLVVLLFTPRRLALAATSRIFASLRLSSLLVLCRLSRHLAKRP